MKQLTYIEAGAELGVHPYHVRRIFKDKRFKHLVTPIIEGYNRITFRVDQVRRVKEQRKREAIKSRHHAMKMRAGR